MVWSPFSLRSLWSQQHMRPSAKLQFSECFCFKISTQWKKKSPCKATGLLQMQVLWWLHSVTFLRLLHSSAVTSDSIPRSSQSHLLCFYPLAIEMLLWTWKDFSIPWTKPTMETSNWVNLALSITCVSPIPRSTLHIQNTFVEDGGNIHIS